MRILLPTADSQRTAWIALVTTDNTNGEEEDSDEDSTTATADDGEEDGTNSNDKKEESSHVAYEEFQGCLSDFGGSPTEQEVQDCMESSYSGIDSNEDTPAESTNDGDEDENGVNENVSTDDTEDDDEDDW